MTTTLVDTNIFIDILGNGPFVRGSADSLKAAVDDGDIVLSAVVWAELAIPNVPEDRLLRRLSWLRPRREGFPFEAGFLAGGAHNLYRERGGRRERTLPDFLIGAHAQYSGYRLLTRDIARYRSYFPDLDLIAPDTHP